jgi:hypothetical protein
LLIDDYVTLRPYLYHLTAAVNLEHILDSGILVPAAQLLEQAGRTDLLRVRRERPEPLRLNGRTIQIRDQSPLIQGNVQLNGGWTFENLVEDLNARCFFWPGNDKGPIRHGVRHFERYKNDSPVLLRFLFSSLLSANPHIVPFFCAYNSGAPRCSNGRRSPRGPETFQPAAEFKSRNHQVVEVSFASDVVISSSAEIGTNPNGPWHLLFKSSDIKAATSL